MFFACADDVSSSAEADGRFNNIHFDIFSNSPTTSIKSEADLIALRNSGKTSLDRGLVVMYSEDIEYLDLSFLTGGINGSILIMYNEILKEIYYPQVEKVKGSLFIQRNPLLTKVDLPDLREITSQESHTLMIQFNESLTEVHLPMLTKIARIDIYQNRMLTYLDLSSLSIVQDYLQIIDTKLLELKLDALTEVKNLDISFSNLQYLDLPSLIQTEMIRVMVNKDLSSIDLPSLVEATLVTFSDNNSCNIFMYMEDVKPVSCKNDEITYY
jgi:hypothetical protein